MDDPTFTTHEDGSAAATLAPEPNEPQPDLLDLPALQDLSPAALQELFAASSCSPIQVGRVIS